MVLVRDIRECGVAAPWLRFVAVAPAGRGAARPARFVLGPASAANLWDIFGQAGTPAVGCYVVEGAVIAPTGFPIRDGVALHGDALMQPRHHVVAVSDRLNAESLPFRTVAGPLVVLLGPAVEAWGHWLTDFLPRLWVLAQAGFDLARLRYVVPPDLPDFGLELLRLCGVRDDQLEVYAHWHEVLRTDLLLLPTALRAGDLLAPCFAAATRFWADRVAPPVTASGGKLFLSRAGAPSGRQLVNRDEIEAMAAAMGLDVVRPETMTVPAQIALCSAAAVIVGEYGSALHDAVFARPGACVCALRGTARHPGFVQTGIATALAQDVGYVFGGTEGDEVRHAFWIDPGSFTRALELSGV